MDQTTFAHQIILRNIAERRKDPGVDCRLNVRSHSNHPKKIKYPSITLHDPTNIERGTL
jgi:hypothetical protein